MIVDLQVAASLVTGAALGAWRGPRWQLAVIGALLSGFVAGLPLSKLLGPVFGAGLEGRLASLAVLYLLISLGVYTFLFSFKVGLVQRADRPNSDRRASAALGAVKGFVFCLAASFFALVLWDDARDAILASRSGRVLAHVLDTASPLWPAGVHEKLNPQPSPDR